MDAKRSSDLSPRRIFLFGGQGSTTTFMSGAATASINAVKSSAEAATLLSRCHAFFLEDLCSIENSTDEGIAIDRSLFPDPYSLLSPPDRYRMNGVLQGLTLLLHQLLHYIAYVRESRKDFNVVFNEIEETTGLCSGMIPALVVASSQNIQKFIHHGVEAFRLVFWVGYHGTLRSRNENRGGFDDQNWLLKLSGVKRSELQQRLDNYAARVSYFLEIPYNHRQRTYNGVRSRA